MTVRGSAASCATVSRDTNVSPSRGVKILDHESECANFHITDDSCATCLVPGAIVRQGGDGTACRMTQRPGRAPPENPSCPVLYADSRYVAVNKVRYAARIRNLQAFVYYSKGRQLNL
jgi:hypothetical protein